jgi:predicted dehydrogenase
MAGQLAERFRIPGVFVDAAQMLKSVRPDVVHITTPPHSHFSLGRMCLESGCHVYMEKPFTVTAGEAESLVELAQASRLRITAGHNLQFSPEALQMRELVRSDFLGGPPIHMESIQCFSHDDPTYGKAVLGDSTHWVRKLPGSLLHNLISHGISKIAEFLPGDAPTVTAECFASPYVKKLGQTDVVDEVRAMIRGENDTSAFFLFSTRLGAGTNEFRLYGRTGNLILDNSYRTLLRIKPARFKSYLRFFFSPWIHAKEQVRNSLRNMKRFVRSDFHMDYGMHKLMGLFQQAIRAGGPDPIPMSEILKTARIMDAIFDAIPRAAAVEAA